MPGTSIETYTGRYFDFADPRPEQVCYRDIARALSQVCRFGGHTERFYSVAEHAVLVAHLVEQRGCKPDLVYAALHHDSHEAYIGDVTTPLKGILGARYRELRHEVDEAIADALGIQAWLFEHAMVKAADAYALRLEAAVLKPSKGLGAHWGEHEPVDPEPYDIVGDEPERAEGIFQRWHTRLYLQGSDRS